MSQLLKGVLAHPMLCTCLGLLILGSSITHAQVIDDFEHNRLQGKYIGPRLDLSQKQTPPRRDLLHICECVLKNKSLYIKAKVFLIKLITNN